MSAKNEAMLRKIRGLLAQAEDPACTPEEAEAFSAKAEELLVKYGIDQAMLDAGKTRGRGKPTDRKVPMVAPYKMPKVTLLHQIASAYGVKMVMIGRQYSHLVGFEADLDAVDLLYTSLLLQCSNAMTRARRASGRRGEDMVAFTNSFIEGFAATVGQRLREQRRTTVDATPGAALVLADRSGEVDAAFKDLFPHVKTVRSRARSDYEGRAAGHRAGQTADIGNHRVGGGHKAVTA